MQKGNISFFSRLSRIREEQSSLPVGHETHEPSTYQVLAEFLHHRLVLHGLRPAVADEA